MTRGGGLPGWRIPTRGCPSRDEMADYLEQYATRFALPVRTGVRVERVTRAGDGFRVETSAGNYLADRVVVATGAHQRPRTPGFAADLDPAIRQLHSLEYRNPGQFAPGDVLVVGAANSGTDIALDAAAAGHHVRLAGRHPGQVPVDIDGRRGRAVVPVVWCTGSDPDHAFLDPSVLDEDGRPRERRGVADEPGLYFLGLDFQFALASATIQGLDRDARYLLRRMRRVRSVPAPHVPSMHDVERVPQG